MAGSFGNPSVRVTKPADMQRRWGDGSVNAGMGESYPDTKITGLYWSSDSAYLAIGQSVRDETPTLTARFGISIRVRMSGGMAKQWAA